MSIANIDDWTLEAREALQNNTSSYCQLPTAKACGFPCYEFDNSIDYSTSNDMSVKWHAWGVINDDEWHNIYSSLNENAYISSISKYERYEQYLNNSYMTKNEILSMNGLSKGQLPTHSIKSKEISRFDLLDID